jgi:hypothetical protein
MGDALDDRRRGLEEEYFNRKNREAIEKLREKMKVAAEAKAAGASTMNCPRCGDALKEDDYEDIIIDTCEKCGGVWFDSGELEKRLSQDSEGWFSKLWFAKN